jgi:prepilin-type processing-associated H-X9-DG protein
MGNGLDGVIVRRPDGSSIRSNPVTLMMITDGTSNTLLAGEKCLNAGLFGQHQTDDDSGWTDGWDWDVIRWGYVQPTPDWYNPDPSVSDSGYIPLHTAFGGPHPGYFNVVLTDGSVRVIPYNINLSVFMSLSSRNDGVPFTLN